MGLTNGSGDGVKETSSDVVLLFEEIFSVFSPVCVVFCSSIEVFGSSSSGGAGGGVDSLDCGGVGILSSISGGEKLSAWDDEEEMSINCGGGNDEDSSIWDVEGEESSCGGVGEDSSARFLPIVPIRRIKPPSFFFLSILGELSVLREASLDASARIFLIFLRIVRSSRAISPSEAEDLVEPERLIEPMWKGEPERNGERSECSVRRRCDGEAGKGAGALAGAEAEAGVHGEAVSRNTGELSVSIATAEAIALWRARGADCRDAPASRSRCRSRRPRS